MAPVRQLSGTEFSASLLEYKRALRHDWHAHDQPVLTLVLAGHVEEVVSGGTRLVAPLDIGFKPAGIRHADRFGDHGVRALRIVLEPPLLAAVEQAAGRTFDWWWRSRSPAVTALMRIAIRLCGSESAESDPRDDLQDALAALATEHRGDEHRSPSTWLRHVREEIDDRHGVGVRLTELALNAGVHPVYLARRFRIHYGCSVGEYIRWRRAVAAIELLRDGHEPIVYVAARVGCSDQPHLTRVLRATSGATPALLRRLVTTPTTEVQNVQDATGAPLIASRE
jgi:AraC family transcriptional regulator